MLGDFGLMGTNQAFMTINLNTRKKEKKQYGSFKIH